VDTNNKINYNSSYSSNKSKINIQTLTNLKRAWCVAYCKYSHTNTGILNIIKITNLLNCIMFKNRGVCNVGVSIQFVKQIDKDYKSSLILQPSGSRLDEKQCPHNHSVCIEQHCMLWLPYKKQCSYSALIHYGQANTTTSDLLDGMGEEKQIMHTKNYMTLSQPGKPRKLLIGALEG